jgi:CheY-like chemotaxis protein
MNQPNLSQSGMQDIRVSKQRKRILYIDDNQDSAEMMPLILAPVGYEVTAATSHQVNMEIVTGGGFDLILLENRLMEGSGIDLCKAIRAFDAEIPIVFYSTSAREKDVEKGLAAGANAYLVKPDGLSQIVQTVSYLLDNQTMTA